MKLPTPKTDAQWADLFMALTAIISMLVVLTLADPAVLELPPPCLPTHDRWHPLRRPGRLHQSP